MTIEEIIEKEVGYHNEYGFGDIERIALEIRRLTIEECKNKVEAYIPYYEGNSYYAEIDQDTFPTDLNNIDL